MVPVSEWGKKDVLEQAFVEINDNPRGTIPKNRKRCPLGTY